MESILQTLTLTYLDVVAIPLAAIAFYCFYRILAKDVILPYLEIYEEREAAITGSIASAEKEKAKELEMRYEQELSKQRALLVRKKLDRLAASQKEAEQIISQAEETCTNEISKFRKSISEELTQKRLNLPNEAKTLAKQITERVGV